MRQVELRIPQPMTAKDIFTCTDDSRATLKDNGAKAGKTGHEICYICIKLRIVISSCLPSTHDLLHT